MLTNRRGQPIGAAATVSANPTVATAIALALIQAQIDALVVAKVSPPAVVELLMDLVTKALSRLGPPAVRQKMCENIAAALPGVVEAAAADRAAAIMGKVIT